MYTMAGYVFVSITAVAFIFGCGGDNIIGGENDSAKFSCIQITYDNSPEVKQFDAAFAQGTGAALGLRIEAYPNANSADSAIAYSIPTQAQVNLSIFSTTGKLLKVLLYDKTKNSGLHGAVWDGTDALGKRVKENIYIQLEVGSKKLILNI